MKQLVISFWEYSGTMENPDLVLQETGSRPTYSRLNYVPSGDTLRQDAISSYFLIPDQMTNTEGLKCYSFILNFKINLTSGTTYYDTDQSMKQDSIESYVFKILTNIDPFNNLKIVMVYPTIPQILCVYNFNNP